MQTIAIANRKGGVGKTATALAIGEELARRGQRVLFVDIDPQCNMTETLRGNGEAGNILSAMLKPKQAAREVQQVASGALLASVPELAGLDTTLTAIGKEHRLQEALRPISGDFDYCLIDCAPSLNLSTVNALTASNWIVCPCQADAYSLQALRQLAGTVAAVREYCNPGLAIMGLLITRYDGRKVITRDLTALLASLAQDLGTRVFDTRIRENIAITEAAALRKPLRAYAPRCAAVRDYEALTDEILTYTSRG